MSSGSPAEAFGTPGGTKVFNGRLTGSRAQGAGAGGGLRGDAVAGAQRSQHPLGDGLAREADLLAQERRLAVGDVAVGQADRGRPGRAATRDR